MTITARGRVEKWDFFRAHWRRVAPGPGFAVVGIFLLVVMYGLFAWHIAADKDWKDQAWSLAFLPGFALISLVNIIGRWRGTPAFRGPLTHSFSEEGVLTETVVGRTEAGWNTFVGFREFDDMVLICQSNARGVPHGTLVLPRRHFSTETDWKGFLELVSRKLKRLDRPFADS